MKILIIDTYYNQFLREFYTRHKNIRNSLYDEQWRMLMDQCFGTSDFYSYNLRQLGYQAHEVVANNNTLQRQWARENALQLWFAYPLCFCFRKIKAWQLSVLKAQVEHFNPDVLYIQDMNWIDERFLNEVREKIHLIVGQTANALRSTLDFKPYNLMITSFPHYVDEFRSRGLSVEYLPLAFDPRVLNYLSENNSTYNVTFVGGFSPQHLQGAMVLEQLAQKIPLDFWGYGVENLPKNSLLRHYHHGQSWGIEMFRILSESRVTLNRHIDTAKAYANNMRLFEATGVGTCLVTDLKRNLQDLFEIHKELVAYNGAEDCIEKVRYLLENTDERATIAKAGQKRTLRDHTYFHRMQQLVKILENHLSHI